MERKGFSPHQKWRYGETQYAHLFVHTRRTDSTGIDAPCMAFSPCLNAIKHLHLNNLDIRLKIALLPLAFPANADDIEVCLYATAMDRRLALVPASCRRQKGKEKMAPKTEHKRHASKHKIDRRLGVNLWGRSKSPLNTRSLCAWPAWSAPQEANGFRYPADG